MSQEAVRDKKNSKKHFVSRRNKLFSHHFLLKSNITHMEITGKIIAVLPERGGISKSGNEWKMQEYVLETHEQYPRKICFNVFGADKIAQFNIQAGEEMTVSFDINAREYNGRWFNDIRAFRIDRPQAAPQAAPQFEAPVQAQAAPIDTTPFEAPSATDDLPF
jgi:hypothetical protein